MAVSLCCYVLFVSTLHLPVLLANSSGKESCPMVETRQGLVVGMVHHAIGMSRNPVYAFYGLPYAAPPVGRLRFADPQSPPTWQGIRQARIPGPGCPQDPGRAFPGEMFEMYSYIVPHSLSEDCLFLNVYTPNVSGKKAVMVWIHGGGFTFGSNHPYNGTALAAYEDVVVVVPNYRIGILGFFSTGDAAAPGNFGLLDQVAALRWVQENIQAFGGDPSRVTIFGLSAGAWSITALLVCPLSEGLFQQAIVQSGSIMWPPLIREKPWEDAHAIARILGCPEHNSTALVECMKELPVEVLREAGKTYGATVAYGWYPPITVDGKYLDAHPLTLYRDRGSKRVPIIFGVNSDEGFIFQWDPARVVPLDMTSFKVALGNALKRFNLGDVAELSREVLTLYLAADDGNVTDYSQILAAILGDAWMKAPTLLHARKHKDAGFPVYFYEISYRPSFSTKPHWVGMDHADELFFEFGLPFLELRFEDGSWATFNCSKKDKKFSKILMKYFSNFAKFGQPNDKDLVHWPKFNKEKHLRLLDEPQSRQYYRQQYLEFWNDRVPGLLSTSDNDVKQMNDEL